jgi:hypothetical protein
MGYEIDEKEDMHAFTRDIPCSILVSFLLELLMKNANPDVNIIIMHSMTNFWSAISLFLSNQ